LEANLTTEAPLNNRREQRRDIKSHDPRGLAVLYPTNQTHPSTPTIPPIQSPAKAESRKTRIKKSDKRVKITAWKKRTKDPISEQQSPLQGGSKSIPGGASQEERRKK